MKTLMTLMITTGDNSRQYIVKKCIDGSFSFVLKVDEEFEVELAHTIDFDCAMILFKKYTDDSIKTLQDENT